MLQRILSILGWIGTALVFGAVAIRFVRPEWNQYATWGAWAGLALVVLYTLGQWREILNYFRRRQARYGALATTGVLAALAITVAVNYLGARQNKRWDLTVNQQNSLSEQTVKVLQSLQAPVKFTVFDRQTELDRFRNRLDEYTYHSRQVSVEYIDPDTRPVIAKSSSGKHRTTKSGRWSRCASLASIKTPAALISENGWNPFKTSRGWERSSTRSWWRNFR